MGSTHETKSIILDATHRALQQSGYSNLSTRRVAEIAEVPLSQIHYHFGSRHNLVLELLARENERLLRRQSDLYSSDMPLWKQWEQACDFLEDDLASGYVTLLQEMTAAGWSESEIAAAVRRILGGWFELLTDTAERAADTLGSLGPFTAAEIATLAGASFFGVEALILLGFEESDLPAKSALRRVGEVLRALEQDQ